MQVGDRLDVYEVINEVSSFEDDFNIGNHYIGVDRGCDLGLFSKWSFDNNHPLTVYYTEAKKCRYYLKIKSLK